MTTVAQRPTLPGMAEGIVSLDPFTIQCRGCGKVATPEDLGVAADHRNAVALVVLLSDIHFHGRAWTTGADIRTDNPRLCRACRLARGCGCESCQYERRG